MSWSLSISTLNIGLQVPVINTPVILKAGVVEPVLASGLSLTLVQPGCSAAITPRCASVRCCQPGCSAITVLE